MVRPDRLVYQIRKLNFDGLDQHEGKSHPDSVEMD